MYSTPQCQGRGHEEAARSHGWAWPWSSAVPGRRVQRRQELGSQVEQGASDLLLNPLLLVLDGHLGKRRKQPLSWTARLLETGLATPVQGPPRSLGQAFSQTQPHTVLHTPSLQGAGQPTAGQDLSQPCLQLCSTRWPHLAEIGGNLTCTVRDSGGTPPSRLNCP